MFEICDPRTNFETTLLWGIQLVDYCLFVLQGVVSLFKDAYNMVGVAAVGVAVIATAGAAAPAAAAGAMSGLGIGGAAGSLTGAVAGGAVAGSAAGASTVVGERRALTGAHCAVPHPGGSWGLNSAGQGVVVFLEA